jgi:hypothetical protein
MRARVRFVWPALCFLAACAAPMQAPPLFVELRDAGGGFRAVTSDDARLWVRDFRDPTTASIEFWAEALRQDFVQQRGYQWVDSGEVKNQEGAVGRWLELATEVDGERFGYLIALWVDGNRVRVVEFTARADVFALRLPAVRQALATVRG